MYKQLVQTGVFDGLTQWHHDVELHEVILKACADHAGMFRDGSGN